MLFRSIFCSCKEAPTTEYEKIRAKNMMRNNRIFQSLGITSLGMIVRNSNRMQQGSAITDGDSASTVTQQGSSSEYSPDYEVIEEDEVDDSVVEEEDKVLILPFFSRDGVYLYAMCFSAFTSSANTFVCLRCNSCLSFIIML